MTDGAGSAQARSGDNHPRPEPARAPADYAGLTAEPPSGGLPTVLGRLREAAADHDDELPGPDRLLPPG